MTVRMTELLVALALALGSIGIMVKSTDGLSIGWIKDAGPGSGAWPFWLSAGMLAACCITILRWFRRATPESRSEELFMSRATVRIVGMTVAALVVLLLVTHYLGMYVALLAFLLFYLRIMGGHAWVPTISLALITPTFLFFFFEGALTIPLPKGVSEPLFYPLYDLIY